MKDKLKSIFSRRSIRRYRQEELSDEMVRDLLMAAMAAPSACAKDPWEFIVVRDHATLAKIAEALPNGSFLAEAGLGLVVCGDLQRAHGGELSYLLQDCSAAIENVLLAASMLGLGACWLGVHPRPERVDFLKSYFQLPQSIVPVAVVSVGWAADIQPPQSRFEERYIHQEKW